jgi:hypothetical protein
MSNFGIAPSVASLSAPAGKTDDFGNLRYTVSSSEFSRSGGHMLLFHAGDQQLIAPVIFNVFSNEDLTFVANGGQLGSGLGPLSLTVDSLKLNSGLYHAHARSKKFDLVPTESNLIWGQLTQSLGFAVVDPAAFWEEVKDAPVTSTFIVFSGVSCVATAALVEIPPAAVVAGGICSVTAKTAVTELIVFAAKARVRSDLNRLVDADLVTAGERDKFLEDLDDAALGVSAALLDIPGIILEGADYLVTHFDEIDLERTFRESVARDDDGRIIGITCTGIPIDDPNSVVTIAVKPKSPIIPENVVPSVTIDQITPNPAQSNQQIYFLGSASDPDGSITAVEWRSDIDGLLSTIEDWNTKASSLRAGRHNITFQAWDNGGNASNLAAQLVTIESSSTELPEILVEGNGLEIPDDDTTPRTEDGTDFGGQPTTAGGKTHSFRVKNTGSAALNIASLGSSSVEFAASGLISTIAAGGFDNFTITFDPNSDGQKNATITVRSNDNNEDPYTFAVTGNGTADEGSLPDPPPFMRATDAEHPDKVVVLWDPASGATSYQIWRGLNTDKTKGELIADNVTGNQYEDYDVTPGQIYIYTIKSKNSSGVSGWSGDDRGWIDAPGAPLPPGSVRASDGGFVNRVQITWSQSAGATDYDIWRGLTSSTATTVHAERIAPGVVGLSYIDTNVEAGTFHYFWVKAANENGVSGWSGNGEGEQGSALLLDDDQVATLPL